MSDEISNLDARCSHEMCRDKGDYSLPGRCSNCDWQGEITMTKGHTCSTHRCPSCECNEVRFWRGNAEDAVAGLREALNDAHHRMATVAGRLRLAENPDGDYLAEGLPLIREAVTPTTSEGETDGETMPFYDSVNKPTCCEQVIREGGRWWGVRWTDSANGGLHSHFFTGYPEAKAYARALPEFSPRGGGSVESIACPPTDPRVFCIQGVDVGV